MRRFAFALILVATLALALGACASGKDTGLPAAPTTPPVGGGTTVTMPDSNLKFSPDTLTVKVGDTVTWKNDGALPHTVTSEDLKTINFGTTTNPIAPGSEVKFTFKKAGTYPYFCQLHSSRGTRAGMIGTITVQA